MLRESRWCRNNSSNHAHFPRLSLLSTHFFFRFHQALLIVFLPFFLAPLLLSFLDLILTSRTLQLSFFVPSLLMFASLLLSLFILFFTARITRQPLLCSFAPSMAWLDSRCGHPSHSGQPSATTHDAPTTATETTTAARATATTPNTDTTTASTTPTLPPPAHQLQQIQQMQQQLQFQQQRQQEQLPASVPSATRSLAAPLTTNLALAHSVSASSATTYPSALPVSPFAASTAPSSVSVPLPVPPALPLPPVSPTAFYSQPSSSSSRNPGFLPRASSKLSIKLPLL